MRIMRLLLWAVIMLCASHLPLRAASLSSGEKDRIPPVLAVHHPAGGEVFDRQTIIVRGVATDAGGIRSLAIRVRGMKAVSVSLADDGSFRARITLRGEANHVEVLATDRAGNRARQTRTVTWRPANSPLRIETPLPGALAEAVAVTVVGRAGEGIATVEGGGKSGVVSGGTFTLEGYPLEPGENLVEVRGVTSDGRAVSDRVAVARATGRELTFGARPEAGPPGKAFTFWQSGGPAAPVEEWQIDLEGTGRYTTAQGITGQVRTYYMEGVFRPAIRAVTREGTILSAGTVVPVLGGVRLVSSIASDDPVALAVDGQKRLLVLERSPGRIRIYDKSGAPLGSVGRPGSGPKEFLNPRGLALDGQGNIYIADTGNHRVQKLGPDFGFLASWGTRGTRIGEFDGPTAVAVDDEGHIHVLDAGNRRVQVLTPGGNPHADWSLATLADPRGILLPGDGTAIVSDYAGGTLGRYHDSGSAVPWEWPPPQMSHPTGLTLDPGESFILAADEAGAILVFTTEGVPVRRIDVIGGDELGLRGPLAAVRAPTQSAVEYFVADTGNSRVVRVRCQTVTRNMPQIAWNEMRNSLAAGDVEKALEWFSDRSRERFRRIFSALGSAMPERASAIGQLVPLEIGERVATYGVVRQVNGKEYLFKVEFMRDGFGQWRIESW